MALKDTITRLRAKHRVVDRALLTQERFSDAGASQHAGAVTYFGFLSVYPILAVAFFFVGRIADWFPDAQETLIEAIDSVLPGLVGDGTGQVSLDAIQDAANAVGIIGLIGVLYAGLGWLSSMRTALSAVFGVPSDEQPNMIFGKLRDLLTLVVLGLIMMVSVVLTGVVRGFTTDIADWINLPISQAWLLDTAALVVGLVANTVLFYVMFRLLARPEMPARALLAGGALAGVGFEVLKQISSLLLSGTQGSPAFQVFGVSLILLVWINYSTKVTLYAAAFVYAGHPVVEVSDQVVQGPQSPPPPPPTSERRTAAAFLSGAATAAVGLLLMRNRRPPD